MELISIAAVASSGVSTTPKGEAKPAAKGISSKL